MWRCRHKHCFLNFLYFPKTKQWCLGRVQMYVHQLCFVFVQTSVCLLMCVFLHQCVIPVSPSSCQIRCVTVHLPTLAAESDHYYPFIPMSFLSPRVSCYKESIAFIVSALFKLGWAVTLSTIGTVAVIFYIKLLLLVGICDGVPTCMQGWRERWWLQWMCQQLYDNNSARSE